MANEHPIKYNIIYRLDNMSVMAGYALLFVMLWLHSYRALTVARGGRPSKHHRNKRKLQTSHWTSAASRGIFIESAKSVSWAHSAIMGSFVTVTAASNLPMLIHFGTDPEENFRSKELEAHVVEQCGPGFRNTCALGGLVLRLGMRVCGGLACAFMLMVLSTPVRFWSPVVLKAAKKEGNLRLQRCIRWLLPAAMVIALWSAHHASFGMLYLS
eukprot:scaffold464340_cov25-Prasinocladus_malaysianus.AAC.1